MQEENKSLFEQYYDDIKKIIEVNEFNMKDIQMGLPAARHFWVSRLFFHKREVNKLKGLRKQARHKIMERVAGDAPVALTTRATESIVEEHDVIKVIDDKIVENEMLVEYLTKIEANFRSISYDISNLIKIIELETT